MVDVYRKKIFPWLGSGGSMHKSYAMFKMHAKGHNDSIEIGLIIAADSRMAGWMIALLHLLQLSQQLKV